jgi:uncharacterized membrane protein
MENRKNDELILNILADMKKEIGETKQEIKNLNQEFLQFKINQIENCGLKHKIIDEFIVKSSTKESIKKQNFNFFYIFIAIIVGLLTIITTTYSFLQYFKNSFIIQQEVKR